MVSGRTRGKLRRERERLEEEAEESSGEINLVPFLDIITNILIFLLMTITSMLAVGNINVDLPQRQRSDSVAVVQPSTNKPDLNLMIGVSGNGFIVIVSGTIMGSDFVPGSGKLPTIPKMSDGKYDFDALSKFVVKLKAEYPDEKRAILAANPDIVYETVIAVMDVLRQSGEKELFPQVLFSTGIL